jgi:mono/diheme cytochrome c family protein
MKTTKIFNSQFLLIGLLLILVGACEKEYNYTLPPKAPPPVSEPTSTLEAIKVSTAPNTINSPYWKTADFLPITAADMSKGLLYGDGGLNLTGTFAGLTSFSKGKDPRLTLKAAYDAEYLYILAEWNDTTIDVSDHTLLFNGNADPLKPGENTGEWTSQRNSDKLSFAFDIDGASGAKGTFATVGCQASCHGTGNTSVMTPTSGSVDFWNWSLATSNPLGYVHDMVAKPSGFSTDAGGAMMARNSVGTTDRDAAKYEWDGTDQTITLPNGATALLDPTYYLLNKTPMIGDAKSGETIYNANCESCHGPNGQGAEAGGINGVGSNKKSRAAYKAAMDDVGDMAGYWGPLSSWQRDDIVTFLRGISGAPGYYLVPPTPGTSSADITVISNVTPIQVSNATSPSTNKHQKYQILIKRKLQTNNPDDVQFVLSTKKDYVFGIALMDNDGKNHIGSAKETLSFK